MGHVFDFVDELTVDVVEHHVLGGTVEGHGFSAVDHEVAAALVPAGDPIPVLDIMPRNLLELIGVIHGSQILCLVTSIFGVDLFLMIDAEFLGLSRLTFVSDLADHVKVQVDTVELLVDCAEDIACT